MRLSVILFVLCVGVGLSVAAFFIEQRWEQGRLEDEFERRTSPIALVIERGLDRNLEMLRSVRNFYGSSREGERGEFRSFVFGMLTNHPELQAVAWVPRVGDSERAAYEEAARQEGFLDFQIAELNSQGEMVRASAREEHFPVYFVEPYQWNERAFGFDLGSE